MICETCGQETEQGSARYRISVRVSTDVVSTDYSKVRAAADKWMKNMRRAVAPGSMIIERVPTVERVG